MIQLGSEQLLEIVLAVAAVAIGAVAAVFLLIVHATRRDRGRRWFWGFAFFALALGLDSLAQHYAALEAALTYAATAAAVIAAYFTAVVAFDFGGDRRVPHWAYALLTACGIGGFVIAWAADLTADLLAPEVALVAATAILAIGLFPVARDKRRSGLRTVCAVAALLTVLVGRTLVCSAILAFSGRELNAVYWTWEVIAGVLLTFVLAMGELVAVLDEIRLELEDTNGALSRALEGLEVAAKIDPLTGLYNRYAFYTLIDDLRQRGKIAGSIVIVDLNSLKKINDSFGHHVGDRALLNVAQRLQEVVRASDYVFRWGGDEFVLLLFGIAPDVARDRMAHMPPPQPLQISSGEVFDLAVSWGVAPLAADVDAALRDADAQLYSQKRLFERAAAKVPNA